MRCYDISRRYPLLQPFSGKDNHLPRMDPEEPPSPTFKKTPPTDDPGDIPPNHQVDGKREIKFAGHPRRRRGRRSRALEAQRLLGDALPVPGILRGRLQCRSSLRTPRRLELLWSALLLLRQLRDHRIRRLCQHTKTELFLRSLVCIYPTHVLIFVQVLSNLRLDCKQLHLYNTHLFTFELTYLLKV